MRVDFVIWSFDHGQWWRPNLSGYTSDLSLAGLYTAEEAGEIVTGSVLAEDVAIHQVIAERRGPPTIDNLWHRCGQ